MKTLNVKMSALGRLKVAAPRQQDMALQRASGIIALRKASTEARKNSGDATKEKNKPAVSDKEVKPAKTMAELDEELLEKLEGRSGDGGVAGLELEDGKPVAMKRGVRENMFRLI